jgi:hypothetical protein
MSDFLHITNGDQAADILKRSQIQGDVLVWRDSMHHGPFPAGLDLDAVSQVRAQYFASAFDLDIDDVARDFRLRNEHLNAAAQYREVILWFEHDLLDQLQILQLLDWFGNAKARPGKLTIICIDRFDGIEPFRGLGQLNCDQMASLFASRQPVSREQTLVAKSGWDAFRSDNPEDLETFMQGELEPLPFLRASLCRYLEEFPWSSDGLTRTERQILTLVSNGVALPDNVFVENMALETALFIGDWSTFRRVESLCNAQRPVLFCQPRGTFHGPPDAQTSRDAFNRRRLSITEAGEQVLAGQLDAAELMERNEWLGGVHVQTGQAMWMWDSSSQGLSLRKF